MLQPRQYHLLTRLLNLPREKHLIQDGVDLVKIKHEVQLAHVPEELVQHLDEEVDGLEVGQLVVVGVDAHAEEEARVPPVHDLRGAEVLAHDAGGVRGVVRGGGVGGGRGAELDEVGLVFLVAGRDEAVDLDGGFSGCG